MGKKKFHYRKPKIKKRKINLNLLYYHEPDFGYFDVILLAQKSKSDARLKHNLMPIRGVLEKLDKIHGVSFNWKPNNKRLGLVAQEVEKVYPDLVSQGSKGGYKEVDYGQFIAILIEAIKELKKRDMDLNKRVGLLESKKTSAHLII